jgi:hypothetical protein
MMAIRKVAATAVCAAAVLVSSGTVLAGERAGNGEWTPINPREPGVSDADPRNAACAFSGLEDDEELGGPGVVQTPHGETAFDIVFPAGVAQVCSWYNNGNHENRPGEPPPPEG